MGRKEDLEQNIHDSYELIREYEEILRLSSDPKEKTRAQRAIKEQRELIRTWLDEYQRIAGGVLPNRIIEIAAFPPEPQTDIPPPAPIHFVHGYSLPANWAARDRELDELATEIRENRHQIIAIIAIGGTGKSALTCKLLKEELPQRGIILDGCLWFSFYVEPSVDRFLAEACRYLIPSFNPRHYFSPFAKSVILRETLANQRCLLVLDGLETMLVAEHENPHYAACENRALRNFLLGTCGAQDSSQVIITSRWSLSDLSKEPGYQEIFLSDLSPEAALDYMLWQGVKGDRDRIAGVCDDYGYHALTLSVLADYLIQPPHSGDIAGVDSLRELPAETPQGAKLKSILEGYWKKLTRPERFFLTRLATSRAGVTEATFEFMAIDDDGNACSVKHPIFHRTLRRLRQSALLQIEKRGSREVYTTHPLIKTYFYGRLDLEEKRQIHLAWINYAKGLPVPDEPKTIEQVEPLLEFFHHCNRTDFYDAGYEIYAKWEDTLLSLVDEIANRCVIGQTDTDPIQLLITCSSAMKTLEKLLERCNRGDKLKRVRDLAEQIKTWKEGLIKYEPRAREPEEL